MYKVSIVIPAFNKEKNIGMLLKSLLSQHEIGYQLNKIMIASDGSSDNTLEIVKLFKDPKIEVLEGRKRLGQISRQNQSFDLLSENNDLILLLEADTLPASNNYIARLIAAIPKDGKFSYVCGDTVPTKSVNFISKTLNIGYSLRHDIFFSSKNINNLYLSTGGRLFSAEFAGKFRWKSQYHEDSYCYRKALESGLPIIFAPNAKTYFKSVETISDYLKQSAKFQKAKDKENTESQVYKLKLSKTKTLKILLKYLVKHPVATSGYLVLFLYSRITSRFAQEYDEFWSIYSSSKNLNSHK